MSYPAAPLPGSLHCANHPDREGVGICVSCRSVVCVECSTRVDRMNYCIRCLDAAAPEAGGAARQTRGASLAFGLPLLVLSFAAAAGIFTLMGFLLAALRAPGGVTAG